MSDIVTLNGYKIKDEKAVRSYDTIALMKADTKLKEGYHVKTKGYYEANDDGHGEYVIVDDDTLVEDGGSIHILSNGLRAKLIINDSINVKQFGAKGDGVTDDTNILKGVISYVYNQEPQSGWRYTRTIYFPKGTYIVTSPLIDSTNEVSGGSFNFVGNGMFNTKINFSGNYLFDNNKYFGFTLFENLSFIGNETNTFMNFVGGYPGNAQSLRINKCDFINMKTVIKMSGNAMCSEVTFFECKINNCGNNDNPCEIFTLDNPQGVNWRFYSTDIESFVGTLFHFLKGSSVYWYQGSCIPSGNSKILDFTNSSYDYFGEGNFPTFLFSGVRIELHGNSYLYYKQNNTLIKGVFNQCGMGGTNIPNDTTVHPISLGASGTNLEFNDCYNLVKYSIESNTNTNGVTSTSDLIYFNNSEVTEQSVEGLIDRSNFSYTGSGRGALPLIFVNGLSFRVNQGSNQFSKYQKYKEQVLNSIIDNGGITIRNADTSDYRTYTYYVNNYVKELNVVGLAKAAYGNTAKFTIEVYDDDDNLIGTDEDLIDKNNLITIPIKKYLKNIKIKTTSDYSGAVAVLKVVVFSITRL